MEMELEPRVKPLPYKIKGMSREAPSQKAVHVLDTDLRNHWSTGTNTKEWILLELEEPCLLSHIRIHNKSVLEWEIAVGLRYKPEAFVKVRPRCEAPRRDMMYPMNYTPCRYIRISCLRGNPIALFFIQLIGVSVAGLEPEFQPVANYLLPNIISHKQDSHDMYLQLLQDIANLLLAFLPQLEADLSNFSDAAESNIRFLAMLAGPFYPILHIVNEREASKTSNSFLDSDMLRNNQALTPTVSSNFEAQPRRARSSSPFAQPAASSMAFRPDAVFTLLRRAYKDSNLGNVCRLASRALYKLSEPGSQLETTILSSDSASPLLSEEIARAEASNHIHLADYSNLFGEEFKVPDDEYDDDCLNVLDTSAVEEGILHVLYACASQPLLCCKLADNKVDFWSALPLVQALLPALRPPVSSPSDQFDDCFTQWKQPFVQHALTQIVALSSSAAYRPLLDACAGYLASYSPSHAKAACVLIDFCSGPLAPWVPTVVAKVDLTIELLEDLLGTIQGVRQSIARRRAALKYILLALSGHMDDILSKYKEIKHKLLFLVEMLEPFLDPAVTAAKNTIAFGDVSAIFLEKQEHTCALALNVIRTAVRRPAVLPSLESEWRRGSVLPSVLLSILGPHMPLPPEIDLCKCSVAKVVEHDSTVSSGSSIQHLEASSKFNYQDDSEGKADTSDVKIDAPDDASLLFASSDLKTSMLRNLKFFEGVTSDNQNSSHIDVCMDGKLLSEKNVCNQLPSGLVLDIGFANELFNLQADYLHLVNHHDCVLRASEFQRLALELHSQPEITPECHDATIDALLLAAECHVNPFFMMGFRPSLKVSNQFNSNESKCSQVSGNGEIKKIRSKNDRDLETLACLERRRDKTVLQILLQAAELDRDYQNRMANGERSHYDVGESGHGVKVSPPDLHSADAVTLVRQNQALLCQFLMQQLQRERHSMHEILIQSLLFLLQSATELFCLPENIIDIILGSAEHLGGLLTSFHSQIKEGNLQLNAEKIHSVLRRWVLLQRLVIASSGSDESTCSLTDTLKGFQYGSLVPLSSWILKISKFSSSLSPLVRFIGWMAVSRYAKQYLREGLFLASDLSQLTCLLSIFGDELAMIDNIVNQKVEAKLDQSHSEGIFHVIYPELHMFFPNMGRQFSAFGETIMEAVGLQLKSLPPSAVPDALCWFSDLCLGPFVETERERQSTGNRTDNLKGYASKNAKAIILYILEAIVAQHMEAILPEIPRVVQILASLCRSSYCDVAFVDSVLCLLKPLISYALGKVFDDDKLLSDDSSCLNFESLCFEPLFSRVRSGNEYLDIPAEKSYQGALMIFILGAFFPVLSASRRVEILQSLLRWADFATFEPTSSFHDYLCSFQSIMDSCSLILLQTLASFGISNLHDSSTFHSCFPDDGEPGSLQTESTEEFDSSNGDPVLSMHKDHGLKYFSSAEEIEEFSKCLESFIFKLNPTVELCWKLHHQPSMKLTQTSATCYLYSKCIFSINRDARSDDSLPYTISSDQCSIHWVNSLEALADSIVTLEESNCWQVASAVIDYLLGLPSYFNLDHVVSSVCSAIKHFCCHAPKISWRLQTDKWLTNLFMRGITNISDDGVSIVDLFCTLLGHSEPEQRSIALNHLQRLVGKDRHGIIVSLSDLGSGKSVKPEVSVPESIIHVLVLSTWDRISILASTDRSLVLRIHAMSLLLDYIPFAERRQLQSFLGAADTILPGLGKLAYPMREGPLTRLSLALLAAACLYSSSEDTSLIPQSIWRTLENMGTSKSGSDVEKRACQALCKLKNEGDDAKEVLREVLTSNPAEKHSDPDFGHIRESILQVIASLTSFQSYFDFFSKKADQEAMELEEAEIEIELLRKEHATQEVSDHSSPILTTSSRKDGDQRLQQLKDDIRSIEKSKLREEIAARRQKKLLVRHVRQKYLEEAALRETELLQELDRERTIETEREIERQRFLEQERAKTRELRYNLDVERERQTQRELQRELEQAESGLRSTRRDFSSSQHSSRPRERYRERENGRAGQEGSLRSSSGGRDIGGSTTPSSSTNNLVSSSTPTIVIAGSRSFSGQPPVILHARKRSDERLYDDNLDGSRDSGDAASVGDPDSASVLDVPGGFGSSGHRHGSRGSRSRQIMERRERDGRREGKWERKHS